MWAPTRSAPFFQPQPCAFSTRPESKHQPKSRIHTTVWNGLAISPLGCEITFAVLPNVARKCYQKLKLQSSVLHSVASPDDIYSYLLLHFDGDSLFGHHNDLSLLGCKTQVVFQNSCSHFSHHLVQASLDVHHIPCEDHGHTRRSRSLEPAWSRALLLLWSFLFVVCQRCHISSSCHIDIFVPTPMKDFLTQTIIVYVAAERCMPPPWGLLLIFCPCPVPSYSGRNPLLSTGCCLWSARRIPKTFQDGSRNKCPRCSASDPIAARDTQMLLLVCALQSCMPSSQGRCWRPA